MSVLQRRVRSILRQQAYRESRYELARRDLLRFTADTHPNYKAGWFHRELTLAKMYFLELVQQKRSPRLIIAAPPRHGKSQIVSRHFPVWTMGKMPTFDGMPTEVILASYGAGLAVKHSQASRALARSRSVGQVFPGILPRRVKASRRSVAATTDKQDDWSTGTGATMFSVGVGGPTTGKGACIFQIDDAIKDATEALSKARRDKVWDWYQTVAQSRVAPGGGIGYTGTPWHVDGPRGRLLEADRGKGRWVDMAFPAIAEEDQWRHPWLAERFGPKLLRRAGEPLHAERWGLERLEEIRESIDPEWWAALYQCTPLVSSGTIWTRDLFERRHHHLIAPMEAPWDALCIFADLPFRKTDSSDYAVFAVWGLIGREMFLLDIVRDRMSYRQMKRAARAIAYRWPRYDHFIVEGRANGDALVDDLTDPSDPDAIPRLITIDPRNVQDRKVLDAKIAANKAARGEVIIPANAPWLHDWVEEHIGFTGSATMHDDQVDTTSMAALFFRDYGRTPSADEDTERILSMLGRA